MRHAIYDKNGKIRTGLKATKIAINLEKKVEFHDKEELRNWNPAGIMVSIHIIEFSWKLLTVMRSPDRTKHLSTVVI